MFQYEYEKRPSSATSSASRATVSTSATEWGTRPTPGYLARRPLPPRPISCQSIPNKTTVPLKVWIIASASCFAVCAALVLATVVITKWGTSEVYSTRELFSEAPEPVYSNPRPTKAPTTEADVSLDSEEINGIQFPILEKLSIFKNIVANRDKNKRVDKKDRDTLASKHQLHPIHDTSLHHVERKIEKKDRPKLPEPDVEPVTEDLINKPLDRSENKEPPVEAAPIMQYRQSIIQLQREMAPKNTDKIRNEIPNFKPTLPDVFLNKRIKLDGYISEMRKDDDYEEYYNDENLYDDYMQSNSMTSYLIEKVQELHDWITSDPDFDVATNVTKQQRNGNEFGQLLKALNESLIEGNVTIVMNKLKDIYFGENYTHTNHTRKVILSNSTDLLSFGILTLDIMLLHNIQLMAWENQESAKAKMLRDPDVFAFNALFLEPSKVEAKKSEVFHHHDSFAKRQGLRAEDDFDVSKNLLENVLEVGMSTARAAIHLGRAYKNTKLVLNQLSNRETLNANIQTQISRNIDANTNALNHLQSSFNKNASAANVPTLTELDCIWLLYCRNLVATSKLAAPYGTMARINGWVIYYFGSRMALRMLTGELAADRALDTMLYEALTGWTELKCSEMFPRCSKVDAASVVMESILSPTRKSQSSNRLR